jgi:hypothetical protein
VVDLVLAEPARLAELFAAINDSDEVVRLRVGDALEKVCRGQPEWFLPYVDRLLDDIGQIEQPSVQWHVAQMLHQLRGGLSEDQARRSTELLQRNLATSSDWIVLNVTMDILAGWAQHDADLATWLVPELARLQNDPRRSVAKRATRRIDEIRGRARGG